MATAPTALPYRPNVLAVFFEATSSCEWCMKMPRDPLLNTCASKDAHCRVLVGLRNDRKCWQFPQGGIDFPTDSSPQDALIREMKEELGLDPTDYEIKCMLPQPPIRYDFDPQTVNPFLKPFKGQEQFWFACSLNFPHQPDLSKATDDEFIDFTWLSPIEALEEIVPFKRAAYLEGLTRLGFL